MAATNQLSEIEVRKKKPFVSQVKKDFYLWYVFRRTINKWGLKNVKNLWYVEKNGNGGDRKEVGEETTTM